MSYILDALRKAERERKLGRVPALSTDQPERPEHGGPPWAWIAVGLLGILVIILALTLWLQHSTTTRAAAPGQAAAVQPSKTEPNSAATTVENSAPTTRPQAQEQQQTVTVNTPNGPVTTRLPALSPGAETEQEAPADEAQGTADADNEPASESAPVEAVAPQPVPATPPPKPKSQPKPQPKPQPAPQPAPAPSPPAEPARPVAPDTSSLVTYNGLPDATRNRIGALNMNVLIYSSKPGRGFVIINGKKYREGDTLAAGPEIVQILPDGVVLYYQNQEFLLPVPR